MLLGDFGCLGWFPEAIGVVRRVTNEWDGSSVTCWCEYERMRNAERLSRRVGMQTYGAPPARSGLPEPPPTLDGLGPPPPTATGEGRTVPPINSVGIAVGLGV